MRVHHQPDAQQAVKNRVARPARDKRRARERDERRAEEALVRPVVGPLHLRGRREPRRIVHGPREDSCASVGKNIRMCIRIGAVRCDVEVWHVRPPGV